MAIEIIDLPGPLGAEVRGVDLHTALPAEDERVLLAAMDRRHLLVFHDQTISGEEQVDLCRHFGPISAESPDGYIFVSNAMAEGVLREGALAFHSDFGFTHEPVQAISLLALEVPNQGAPTVFADATGILERMEPSLRDRLDRSSVVNVFDFTLPGDRRMREREIAPGSPVVERDTVGHHPRTGAPVIQANAMHTDRVVGLDDDESEALLSELFAVLYADDNVFVLEWQVGDLVLWDNIALQHHRPEFPSAQARTMRRVCIHHKTTIQLVPNIADLLGA